MRTEVEEEGWGYERRGGKEGVAESVKGLLVGLSARINQRCFFPSSYPFEEEGEGWIYAINSCCFSLQRHTKAFCF